MLSSVSALSDMVIPEGQAVDLARAILRQSSYRELAWVECLCETDTLILRGAVPSYYLKQQAQALLAAAPLSLRINNQIVVRQGV